MSRFRSLSILLLAGLLYTASAQDHHARHGSIDVLSYHFEIDLNDTTNQVRGVADIEIAFLQDLEEFALDLRGIETDSTGMRVHGITMNGKEVMFQPLSEQIILTGIHARQGENRSFRIKYSGIPADGLIISKNKFGDRTFFGDNWPNRGHHWLPLVDHPSDKASVEFLVHAPEHYQVVSVGTRQDEFRAGGRVTSHWKTAYPLSTKMMVIGLSPFAVQHLTSASGIPVSSWVYPQNKEEGFLDYAMAIQPLDYFESYVGPYPFRKLANVQSKTVYGGMENASCIFYHERSVSGDQRIENLLAHEIAHQWFGDAVSELDWHHIWLSEGFATYLTDLYIEHMHGRKAFLASMLDEKGQVLRFARHRLAPIVDTTLPVSARLLNKNSYEKAGWVLHMLRHELGDETFRKCIQAYYKKFKYGNALTEDFLEVVEEVSGKEFAPFFQQWFYVAGHPVLSYAWENKGKTLEINIKQHQEQHVFHFPLEIQISGNAGQSVRKTVRINAREQSLRFELPFRAKQLVLDPDAWLLYELRKL